VEALTNALANSFIQYPVFWATLWHVLGLCVLVLIIVGYSYIAFGKHLYYHSPGSLTSWCWKTGWMLQCITFLCLGYYFSSPSRASPVFICAVTGISLALIVFAELKAGPPKKRPRPATVVEKGRSGIPPSPPAT